MTLNHVITTINMFLNTEYESLFNEIPLELIVETSFYQTVYPVKIHTVDSFVGKFCINRNVMKNQ